MVNKEVFGSNIRKLRNDNKWTRDFLAEKVEITPDYLGNIERGEDVPSFNIVYKIALALDTTVDALLNPKTVEGHNSPDIDIIIERKLSSLNEIDKKYINDFIDFHIEHKET